jgi:hypothetical protein
MFSGDSDEYLLGFKDFLLARQAEKEGRPGRRDLPRTFTPYGAHASLFTS